MEAEVRFAGTLKGPAERDENIVVAAVPPLHTARKSSRHVFAAPFCLYKLTRLISNKHLVSCCRLLVSLATPTPPPIPRPLP